MSSLFSRSVRRRKIIVLGPRGTGKTTLVYRLAGQPLPVSMVPTAYDVLEKSAETNAGRKLTLSEQKQFTPDADAIIYVVSAHDFERQITLLKAFAAAREEKPVPLLVLLNKRDELPAAKAEKDVHDLADALFASIDAHRSFNVLSCSARTDESLGFVLDWLDAKLN